MSLASLFEGNFSVDWIIELTGHKPSQVFEAMEEGIQKSWLFKLSDGFFHFKNIEVQTQWKEKLQFREKQNWHRKIAEFLLREFADDKLHVNVIANHLLYVENDVRGCRFLLRAANDARKTSSFQQAFRYYTKILGDLFGKEGFDVDLLFIETAIQYARISIAREDTEKIISILKEAFKRARYYNMQSEAFLLTMHLAKNKFLQSNFYQATQYFNDGCVLLKEIGEPKPPSAVTAFRLFNPFWQGRLKEVTTEYEKLVSTIDKFPSERLNLLAIAMVGFCYALSGNLSQGLGMINALYKHCLENGDLFLASDAEVTIAGVMIELRRPDEALRYLKNIEIGSNIASDWNLIRALPALAVAHYLKGNKADTHYHLTDWLKRNKAINVNIIMSPMWFELCKALEDGDLPHVEGISLGNEIQRHIDDSNVLMKGIAYRYRSYMQKKNSCSQEEIIESLFLSSKYLKESGHVLELCRTYSELLQHYQSTGNDNAAKKVMSNIEEILGSFNRDFIPEDLRVFIKTKLQDWEYLCDEMLKLSQSMSAIRNEKQLLQIIISTANRITGAERGAVFGLEENINETPKIVLRATKNITSAQISAEGFKGAKKLVEEVVCAGKGKIIRRNSANTLNSLGKDGILSQVCVPMIIRDKVVGALYHDNNLFINSFQEADLKLLNYFAIQAAIALDHAEAFEEIKRLNKKLNYEKQYYKEQSYQGIQIEGLIGKSKGILQVLKKIEQVANTGTTVLVLGETGVGKDIVARAIHERSDRKNQPFIKILCNALPESLIASELFGHEKGAFTGSIDRRIGRFELADGGTIFLDEIGDLPLDIQTRLLNVLQNKEFERVGGSETIKSDFRLIAATNRDVAQAVKDKTFRLDLFYRLSVFPIHIPPLRERKEDIPILAYHFLNIFSNRMGKTFNGVSKLEMENLMHYDWPGNIRELEGIIERGTVLSTCPHFRVPELKLEPKESTQIRSNSTLEELERSHILKILDKTGWKVRGSGGAAEILNVNYSTLFFRMKKLGIQRPQKYQRKVGKLPAETL